MLAPLFPPIPRLPYSASAPCRVNLAACAMPSCSPTPGPYPPYTSPLARLLECTPPLPCGARRVSPTSSQVGCYSCGAPLSARTSNVRTACLTHVLTRCCNTCRMHLSMTAQMLPLRPPHLPPTERGWLPLSVPHESSRTTTWRQGPPDQCTTQCIIATSPNQCCHSYACLARPLVLPAVMANRVRTPNCLRSSRPPPSRPIFKA
jgi:hypothetical protein